jgi:hypothetical protein
VKLFLDTSVLLAACGSARGASRALFHLAPKFLEEERAAGRLLFAGRS